MTHRTPEGLPLGYVLHTVTTHCQCCGRDTKHNEAFTCVRAGSSGKAWHPAHEDARIYALTVARNLVTRLVPFCDFCVDAFPFYPLPADVKADPNKSNFAPPRKEPATPKAKAPPSLDDLFIE